MNNWPPMSKIFQFAVGLSTFAEASADKGVGETICFCWFWEIILFCFAPVKNPPTTKAIKNNNIAKTQKTIFLLLFLGGKGCCASISA